jgi:hypothetical protein
VDSQVEPIVWLALLCQSLRQRGADDMSAQDGRGILGESYLRHAVP